MKDKQEKIRKHFEANMLNGDDLHDCGRAMISAESCFEYVSEALQKQSEGFAKQVEELKRPYYNLPPDLKAKEIFYNQALEQVLHIIKD